MSSKFDQLIERYLNEQKRKKRKSKFKMRKKGKSKGALPPLEPTYKTQDTAMFPGRI